MKGNPPSISSGSAIRSAHPYQKLVKGWLLRRP